MSGRLARMGVGAVLAVAALGVVPWRATGESGGASGSSPFACALPPGHPEVACPDGAESALPSDHPRLQGRLPPGHPPVGRSPRALPPGHPPVGGDASDLRDGVVQPPLLRQQGAAEIVPVVDV